MSWWGTLKRTKQKPASGRVQKVYEVIHVHASRGAPEYGDQSCMTTIEHWPNEKLGKSKKFLSSILRVREFYSKRSGFYRAYVAGRVIKIENR